ncbi:YobI family P-loop NTPase [Sinorhizobium fredii]|uniref:YobI family P-loop NTPase n=1 Tax=Rhizobium fredii TaxID=380 RepID=UPI0035162742
MFEYRAKLADWLTAAADRLNRRPHDAGAAPKYVDLAPTDQADTTGVYSTALTKATSNPRVMNIALTGPYGSGKSSIIKSFLKNYYKRPVMQISLAAFLPEATSADSKVGKQEIERSILQQMLYGADANRLPLSRFKRIQSPGRWSMLASLFMIVGVIACWHLFQKRDAIMSGAYFRPFDSTNWFNLLAFAIGGGFIWQVVHHLYNASFGISLKSISLKDIEITPKAATEESILNRHLDEIIYFFQSTQYDLVVIEDLDRFNNADIFVTLREINGLVNANLRGKRHIRFLYALRDDMFVNTDRTKFFEFIIPVIPIINSSNSIDKVLEQGNRLALNDRLNHQFLREVSRYLNDLRLIQNIFNEYGIYVANLETENEHNLDVNKLLAVLIYKNVFPSDFESLHRGQGKLAQILRSHDRYIATSEARYTAEISRLEKVVDQAEQQLPDDVAELRRIYAMAIVEIIPEGSLRVGVDRNQMIPLNSLANNDLFESILGSNQLFAATLQGQHHRLDITELQARVDRHRTYQERKEHVEKKSAAFKSSALKEVRELRAKLGTLRLAEFNEVIRENADEADVLFEEFGDDSDLARFLVLEGYLDDTYYQYTSLFHSGRLSPSDNKFLIRIRSFRNPDPDFQIDNTKEVIAAMRDEDFSRNYVLNVTIVDCLLGQASMYGMQTKGLFAFMASNFSGCETFMSSYYARGTSVAALISGLARAWPAFVAAAIASPANLMHVAHIISHLPSAQLKSLADAHPELSDFVSNRLADILAQGLDFPAERLQLLNVEVSDLSSVEAYPSVLRVLFDNGLYELSVENLNFIFLVVLRIGDADRASEQNYTLVLESGSAQLQDKVDSRFGDYLRNVLLGLPDNRRESISAIRHVIERDDVEFETKVEFLEKQATLLPTLDQVPDKLHATLFQIAKIAPTWENCLAFLGSGTYDAEILTQFLNTTTAMRALAVHEVLDGNRAAILREFIIQNDALSEEAYEAYVRALPSRFNVFPQQLSAGKIKILVDQNIITFSAGNLMHISEYPAIGVAFVKNNITEFFDVEGECDLDDDFRQKLLESDINDENRLRILRTINLSLLAEMPARAAIVGNILARTGVKIDGLTVDAARAIILNSQPLATQISLFNLLHEMFDDQQVRDILNSLPDPLPDIRPGFATPKIESSEVNLKFVTWLKDRGFISSWRRGGFFDDDIRMNMFRK